MQQVSSVRAIRMHESTDHLNKKPAKGIKSCFCFANNNSITKKTSRCGAAAKNLLNHVKRAIGGSQPKTAKGFSSVVKVTIEKPPEKTTREKYENSWQKDLLEKGFHNELEREDKFNEKYGFNKTLPSSSDHNKTLLSSSDHNKTSADECVSPFADFLKEMHIRMDELKIARK